MITQIYTLNCQTLVVIFVPPLILHNSLNVLQHDLCVYLLYYIMHKLCRLKHILPRLAWGLTGLSGWSHI